jgi:hypothetical protein
MTMAKFESNKQEIKTYSLTYLLTYLLTYSLTYLFTPWSIILLEKLTGLELLKKFPHFMEPEILLPHSQVPTICPYPEPAQSIAFPHIPLPEGPSGYYPPIYACVSPVVSFPQISQQKPCTCLSSHPFTLYAGDEDALVFVIKIVLVHCNCLLYRLTSHPEHPYDDPY